MISVNSKILNALVVLMGSLIYFFSFQHSDWFMVGGLAAMAAGVCFGNLLLWVIPLRGLPSDWISPLILAIAVTIGATILRSPYIAIPVENLPIPLTVAVVTALGLFSIPYRIARSKLHFSAK